jgi:N-acetylmuramoyl-L-alanine amidase
MSQLVERLLTRPWVNRKATRIDDPVGRLHYLQSVAGTQQASRRKLQRIIGFLTLLALGLGVAPVSLRMLRAANPASPTQPALQPNHPVVLARVPLSEPPGPEVWPVEKTSDFETYSNGLRIENQFAVSHRPRAYLAFSLDYPDGTAREKRTDPVGIVYHTTESLQAPFEPSQNNLLKRVGESLLDYVRRRRCYNFLIDRFGRVFRIVNETDAADHAGHSVWADDRYFYVNLNDSFLGVSFEAQTGAGETRTTVGSAQVRAAAMLTEMLRSRYKIAGRNCVTHAQVSVNPSNMQIGYHVDWASSFPFESVGLPDNYATPSPAVALFGFAFDASFQQLAGFRLAAGALDAERGLTERAEAAHLSLAAYRKGLHGRYSKITGVLMAKTANPSGATVPPPNNAE